MVEIIGKARARLADVQCSRMQFQPGDRILVRVFQQLDKEQLRRLQRSVERWAGNHVEVLIIDVTKMEISVERAKTLELPRSPQG